MEVCVPAIYKSHSLNISEAFSVLWSNWGQRFQLVAFLLLGLIFATLHHLLGNFLSGKHFSQVVSYGRWAVPSQPLVSALNNVLSHIVKWLLASTIGVVFAQYFWSATKNYHDWRKLDAPLAAANGNPYTISALPTWYRSPGLAFSALMMMSMIFIPIFVPGSIQVVTASGLTQPCTIDSPNISLAYLANRDAYVVEGQPNCKATSHTTALVNRIIVGGSYLPVPNSCGVCAYGVKFTAPSLQCSSDINGTYDFSTNLPLSYKEGSGFPILNGTLTWPKSGYALTVATRDGVVPNMNPPVAVRCYAFRADYHVRVQHDNFSSHVDILNVTLGSPISPVSYTQPSNTLDFALGGLVLAVGKAFSGSVIFDLTFDGFAETPLSVAYSPLLHWNRTNYSSSVLTMSNLTTSLPRLMQNVSLSLLSGQFTSENQTYMEKVRTECSMTQLVYEYNSSRLLAIYVAAWAAAAIFFSLGFLFVWKNEGEHNLAFSHVVEQRHLGSYSRVPLIPDRPVSSAYDMPPLQQTHSASYSESSDFPHS